jgi:hypothetical protein
VTGSCVCLRRMSGDARPTAQENEREEVGLHSEADFGTLKLTRSPSEVVLKRCC